MKTVILKESSPTTMARLFWRNIYSNRTQKLYYKGD